jgi:tellurite resistance protein
MTTTPHLRITPNLFGISFGLTGLGEVWATASRLYGVPAVVSDVLLVIAAVVWAVTVSAYVRDVATNRRWRSELRDPVFAPFVALIAIVPMLLGVNLAEHLHGLGVAVTTASIVIILVLGGDLIGQWIVEDLSLAQWHPGYFIPTVAGGFLGAESLATLGHHDLAMAMFGYGAVSWLVLGSILLQRMFVEPHLPAALLPTMAIQMAPPVVAGVAWFSINGDRADGLSLAIAGYAVLMAVVQLRLIPLFRTAPFGPGWWAFSFSYAAVFLDGVHWLSIEGVSHGSLWTWLLLLVVSSAVVVLVARTALALRRGRFLPAPTTLHLAVAPEAPALQKEHTA